MQATHTRKLPRPVLTAACSACGQAFDRDTLQTHKELNGEACELCRETADKVLASADEAAKRHRAGIVAQLRGIVRDVRSGAEFPSYFAGL